MNYRDEAGYAHVEEHLLEPQAQPLQDAMAYLRQYARENPETAALWCVGLGFILGWRLKPW